MPRTRSFGATRAGTLLAILALGIVLGGGLLSTAAQQPNGAGLVIRHGDGTLVYAYVQFDEESISGAELLTRSGIEATMAPFGGLGGAVCSLNGEGCPSDNCFCHSYTSPAYFWNYFVHDNDTWINYPVGPSSRSVHDGDIDGWAWTAGEHGLPVTSIDEISAMNGFDRSSPGPADTPLPEPTARATQEPVAATTTPATLEPAASPTAVATSQAVIVAPDATPAVFTALESDDSGGSSYLIFIGMAAVVVVVGSAGIIRNRTGRS